jgi:hypothetical protein
MLKMKANPYSQIFEKIATIRITVKINIIVFALSVIIYSPDIIVFDYFALGEMGLDLG